MTGFKWTWDCSLLLALAVLAAAVIMATPALITPFPATAPWFESAAFFPRAALVLVVLGALAELWQRRKNPANMAVLGGSEELDSSSANIKKAIGVILLFALYMLAVPLLGYLCSSLLFLLACARVLGLPWKTSWILALPLSALLWLVFAKALHVSFGHGWLI